MGADTHLQVKRLLLKLEGESVEEGRLRQLLSPIFAKSEEEQLLFKRAFQRYFQQFDRQSKREEAIAEEQRLKDAEIIMDAKSSSWKYLVAIILAFLIGGGIFWKVYLQDEVKAIDEKLDSTDSLTIDKDAILDTTETVVVNPPTEEVEESEATEEINLTELEGESIPLTTKGELLEEDISHLEAGIWHLYGLYLKWGGIFLALFAFVLYEFFRWRRRKLILVKEELKKQPHHFHHIRLSHPDLKLFQSEEFYETAKAFRRRVASNNTRLDVEKSVETTIDEGGYPTFAYNSGTRAPEYLVLIDQPHIKSHQTRLFEQWVKELQQQDIFIERFFYRSDPRVCWKNAFEDDVYLEELANRYPKHRLLIFGDAEALVNPQNDELREWVNLFETWQQKAILSPKPTQWWTYPEITLSEQFILLPAQPYALARLIGIFEGDDDGNLGQWLDLEELEVPPSFDAEPTPNLPSSRHKLSLEGNKNSPLGRGWGWVKTELQSYLSPQTYQWLCACAVYPELHWDFTLQLGKALQLIHDYKANPINDLLKLSRLPWFQTGRMPDELRMALIRDLDKETEEVVKQEIVALMEREQTAVPVVKPLANVFAAYEMLLVVKKWENIFSSARKPPPSPSESSEQALQRGNTNLSESSEEYSILEYVDPATKVVLGFQLPDFLQKVFYKSGMPMLGTKEGFRWTLAGVILLLSMFLIYPPKTDCIAHHQNQRYYLDTSKDSAQFFHQQALDYLKVAFVAKVSDSLLRDTLLVNCMAMADSALRLQYLPAHITKHRAEIALADYAVSAVRILEEKGDSLEGLGRKELAAKAYFYAGASHYAQKYEESPDRMFRAADVFSKAAEADSSLLDVYYARALVNGRKRKVQEAVQDWEYLYEKDSAYFDNKYKGRVASMARRLQEETSDSLLKQQLEDFAAKLAPKVEGNMIFVEGGSFQMGSNDGGEDEQPVHEVVLDDFYIDEHEVTNVQYAQFLNDNTTGEIDKWINLEGSSGSEKCRIVKNGDIFEVENGYENNPVIYVSWYGADAYAKWAGKRLPTEAEWEYAAKGGQASNNYTYSGSNDIEEVAWYDSNSNSQTHEIKTKKPNELGIYDMSGNVYEWCADWYDADYYKNSPRQNPQGLSSGASRVLRGGSWYNDDSYCRPSNRGYYYPDNRYDLNGFRLARTP